MPFNSGMANVKTFWTQTVIVRENLCPGCFNIPDSFWLKFWGFWVQIVIVREKIVLRIFRFFLYFLCDSGHRSWLFDKTCVQNINVTFLFRSLNLILAIQNKYFRELFRNDSTAPSVTLDFETATVSAWLEGRTSYNFPF